MPHNGCNFTWSRNWSSNGTELIDGYHKSSGRPRYMLKVYIMNAYDFVDWDFMWMLLQHLNFPPKFIAWTSACVTSAWFSISLNGSHHGFFLSSRGLRQGDSLSPYRFIIIMESFDYLMKMVVADVANKFKYHPLCQHIELTHICFVDDLCIVSFADNDSIQTIKNVLIQFGEATRLKPNLNKSSCFFTGISDESEDSLSIVIGIPKASLPVKYLGIPLITTHVSAKDCRPLIDKIRNRIDGWRSKDVSFVARIVLINSLFFGMVKYWCQSMILPDMIIKEIDEILRAFLWKGQTEGKCAHKVRWKTIVLPEKEDGLSVKSIVEWNRMSMSQHVLNICSHKEAMWIR
ncbi:reverse transcriptase [Lithospermum erythrorhizon]|uniref:Reverse transcriptase n=1 Tax=Lithospermum erythrorhizon TaxID=34254 RepID=A0AAV3PGC0_LITER